MEKQMGLQSLAECGQRLSMISRRDVRRQVVPSTCGNNRKGTVGDRQPDGRHYQTAGGRTKRLTARLVSDAIEWF